MTSGKGTIIGMKKRSVVASDMEWREDLTKKKHKKTFQGD